MSASRTPQVSRRISCKLKSVCLKEHCSSESVYYDRDEVSIKIAKIHKAGICLPSNNFVYLTVLERNDSPDSQSSASKFTLVGFSKAHKEQCRHEGEPNKQGLQIGRWEPDYQAFGCKELFHCLKEIQAWIPSKFRDNSLNIPLTYCFLLDSRSFCGITINSRFFISVNALGKFVKRKCPGKCSENDVTLAVIEFTKKYGSRLSQCGWYDVNGTTITEQSVCEYIDSMPEDTIEETEEDASSVSEE